MLSLRNVVDQTAGDIADALFQDPESALRFLSDGKAANRNAALSVCFRHWRIGKDPRFISLARDIAKNDSDDSVRWAAIRILGESFSLSRSEELSQFLADIIVDNRNSEFLKQSAYLSLREVQFGATDEILIDRRINAIRELAQLGDDPTKSEENLRKTLTHQKFMPEERWSLSSHIDLQFVGRFR